jgi:CAAX protease family protein
VQSDSLVQRIFLKDGRLRPILRSIVYIVAVGIATGFLFTIVSIVAGFGLTRNARSTGPTFEQLFLFEACLCAAVVGVAILLRRSLDRRSVASLGFALRGVWIRLLAFGILLGAGMQCFVFAIDELFGYSHVTSFAPLQSDLVNISEFILLFALVAVAEEMLTRGYLFQNIWEEWGAPAAIILTSALFAALHLGNPNSHAQLVLTLSGLVAYGLWASASLIYTKSLWPAVGVHFAWNLFEGPVLGFPVSGLNFGVPAVGQTIAGPDWFTGGAFGPESGASSLLALVLGFAVLYWLHRRGAFSDAFDAREAYARASDQKSSSASSAGNSSSSSP